MSETENTPTTSDESKERIPEPEKSYLENSCISPLIPTSWSRTEDNLSAERLIAFATFQWELISSENLRAKYSKVFSKSIADECFERLELGVEYMNPEISKVLVHGKWHPIRRKQAVYGDDGLTYRFSGNTIAAKHWSCCPIIEELKRFAEFAAGELFNLVVVNRYKDGKDYIGEHKYDKKNIDWCAPIASLSFGQAREFHLRHKDSRGKSSTRRDLHTVKHTLESGSILIMETPTNRFWYYSIPIKRHAPEVRVGLIFRKMITNNSPVYVG